MRKIFHMLDWCVYRFFLSRYDVMDVIQQRHRSKLRRLSLRKLPAIKDDESPLPHSQVFNVRFHCGISLCKSSVNAWLNPQVYLSFSKLWDVLVYSTFVLHLSPFKTDPQTQLLVNCDEIKGQPRLLMIPSCDIDSNQVSSWNSFTNAIRDSVKNPVINDLLMTILVVMATRPILWSCRWKRLTFVR